MENGDICHNRKSPKRTPHQNPLNVPCGLGVGGENKNTELMINRKETEINVSYIIKI